MSTKYFIGIEFDPMLTKQFDKLGFEILLFVVLFLSLDIGFDFRYCGLADGEAAITFLP